MLWMRKLLLLLYLGAASYTDVKRKTVSMRMAVLFGVLALAVEIYVKDPVFVWLAGAVPGCFLLLLSRVTREAVGYGDGVTLAVIGLFTGFAQAMGIFMGALLILCPVALLFLIWKRDRKMTLPFVPFLLAAYLLRLAL